MANSYAGQARLARADYVPSRRDQVDNIAQRRLGDDAMRIVGQQRLAAYRQRSGHRPVVAALDGGFGKVDGDVAADEALQQFGRQAGEIDSGGGIKFYRRVEVEEFGGFICAEKSEELCVL